MSANRFTQFRPQQYVESYTPLDFKTLAVFGDLYQQKADKAIELLGAAGTDLSAVQTLNRDDYKKGRDALVEAENKRLQELQVKAIEDPIGTLPEIKQYALALKQNLTSGPLARHNALAAEQAAYIKDLYGNKKLPQAEKIRNLQRSLERTAPYDVNELKNTSFFQNQYYEDPGITKRLLEYRDAMSPQEWDNVGIVKDVDASGNVRGYYDKSNKGKWLSEAEITKRLIPMLYTDIESMNYLGYKSDLDTPWNPSEYGSFDNQYTSSLDRDDAVNKYLNGYINEVTSAIGNATPVNVTGGGTSGYDESGLYNKIHGNNDELNYQPVQFLETSFDNNDEQTAVSDINNALKFIDFDGSISEANIDLDYSSLDQELTRTDVTPTMFGTTTGFRKPTKNINYNKQKELVNKIVSKIPSLSGKSDKEVLETYKRLVSNNVDKKAFLATDLGNLDNAKVTKDVLQSLPSRTIKITGNNTGSTLEDVVKILGISEEGFKKSIESGYVYGLKPLSLNNPGSFVVSVKDGKGVQREITISGTKNQQTFFTPYVQLMQKPLQGEFGIDESFDPVTGSAMISNTDVAISPRDGLPYYGTSIYPVASLEGTKTVIDKYGSVENAIEAGYAFTKDSKGNSRVILKQMIQDITGNPNGTLSPEDYTLYLNKAWLNSKYNNKYKRDN